MDRIIDHLKLALVSDRPSPPQAALQEYLMAADPPVANFCPMVTPDGKYIFYGTYNDIYWVSAEILKPLRAK